MAQEPVNPYSPKFRPSKAPGFMQCPSYIMEYERPYQLLESDESMEFANLGIACHDLFAQLIVPGEKVTQENILPFCEKHNVEYEGFMGLARKAFLMEKKWQENLAKFFIGAQSEQFVSAQLSNGETVQGTPDLFKLHGEYALILDLKSGETDLDYTYQLMTYALILYKLHGAAGLETFYLYMWAPVIDSYIGIEITGADLEAFEVELIEQWQKVGKEFKPGPWCGYCDNLEVCPSHRNAFLQMEDQVSKITIDNIAQARPIIQAMKKIVEKYENTEKALLEKYPVIDLGDGHELYHQTIMKKSFSAPKVVETLSKDFGIGLDKIGPHLKITKKAIEEISGDNAPPRGKTKYRKEVIESLVANGAATETITKRRSVRRITKEVEAE